MRNDKNEINNDKYGTHRLLLTDDEILVVNKLMQLVGMDKRFSLANRNLDNEQLNPVKRRLMFDRFYDDSLGHCVDFVSCIRVLDKTLTTENILNLSESERNVYGGVLDKCHIASANTVVRDSSNIFRDSGLNRRIFRWMCMDELAMALKNTKAMELWIREGHPKTRKCKGLLRDWIQTMDEFRMNETKGNLTIEEFDRIAAVFLMCVNMK